MSIRRRTAHLLMAAFAAAMLFVAIDTEVAEARDYAVVPCTYGVPVYPYPTGGWFGINPYGSLRSEDHCPNNLTIANDPTGDPEFIQQLGAYTMLTLSRGSLAKLDRVQFKVTGGDPSGNLRYSVRGCYDCADVATFDAPGEGNGSQMVDIPLPKLDQFAFAAECVALLCPDTERLLITELRFELRDDTPPGVGVYSTPSGAIAETGPDWVRSQDLYASIGTGDLETGVSYLKASIDGQVIRDMRGFCDSPWGWEFITFMPCQPSLTFDGMLDLRGMEDGEHTLKVEAANGLAEVADPWIGKFRLDNTAPPEVEGLRILSEATESGWTTDPIVLFEWDDPTNDPTNLAGSEIVGGDIDLEPLTPGAPNPPPQLAGVAGEHSIAIPEEGAWRLRVRVNDAAGNKGDWKRIPIGLDLTTPAPPELDFNDWISFDTLIAGYKQTWSAPAADGNLESEVCGYAVEVDDDLWSIPDVNLDELVEEPFLTIHPSIGPGRHFVHARSVSCAGIASATATVALNVDNTDPEVRVVGLPQNEWPNTPFSVNLVAADSGSRVAELRFRFAGDDDWTVVSGSTAAIDVPEGTTAITYLAVDNAGNASMPAEAALRLDTTPPAVLLERRNPNRPLEIVATASDAGSGIRSAAIEYHRRGDADGWRTLGLIEQPTPVGAKSVAIARLFDEEALPPGSYELRIFAVDVAGNVIRDDGQAVDAEPLALQFPLRQRADLAAGIATYGKRGKVDLGSAANFKRIKFGRRTAIVGQLLDGARAGLVDKRVEVLAQPVGGERELVGATTTDANGRFSFPMPAGPSRNLTIRFAGTDTLGPAERRLKLRVRAALTLKASRRSVRVGRTVRFSGRLLSGGIGLPPGGKDVAIRFFSKGRWLPGVGTPTADSRGRFHVDWSPNYTDRAYDVFFQARVKSTGWPFETGVSESVKVRIKP